MSEFIEKPINIKELPKEFPIDSCLLENNEKQIGQICDFLMGDKNLLQVNGFKGCGKSEIVNFTSMLLSQDVVLLHYTCLETTILDDMLLNFFDAFRGYTMVGMISQPKIKVENFNQRINAYFSTITKPILIVIDSFECLVKENKTDIVNFLKHLLKFPNVKIILIGKTVAADDFSDFEYDKVTMLAFSQKVFEKYLRDNGIKNIGVLSNELYKLSKGYYNYLKLAVNIINLRQLTLVSFLELYSKSYMGFSEFIVREAISLVDPVSAHLFRLLTVMRIPIHVNLLKSLHLYDEQKVMFFVQNSLLSVAGECLYLKDTLRVVMENQIPENVMIKLHTACIDLYNTQLPLKPLERDLMLSRQTMRNEIEYHSMFIPKKPVLTQTVQSVMPNQAVMLAPQIPQVEQVQEKVQEVPQKETTPFYPRSPYGVAKQYGFWITKNYRESYGMYAVNGILFNHESERRGENFVTRKITLGVGRILAGQKDCIYLGNMDALRDWGYAKDYVECMWLILQHPTPEDFVIATGEYHTVREFAYNAFKAAGIEIKFEGIGVDEKGICVSGPEHLLGKTLVAVNPKFFRPCEVDQLLGDPTKAKELLGWNPRKTSFEDLVKIMVEHDIEYVKTH